MSKTPRSPRTPRQVGGREPKMGRYGMLTIEFKDVVDKTTGYIAVDVDRLTYITKKQKGTKPLNINETLYYPINNPKANVHFFLYKPRIIGPKCIGFHQFNITSLTPEDAEMHYITSIKKPKNIIEPDIGEIRPAEPIQDKKKKKKKGKEKKPARFNVSIKFTPVPVEEKKLEGIVHEGEWKKGYDAGSIISNPEWYKNPQYLLTLSTKSHVTITLKQDNINNRVTYFIVKYDYKFYEGTPLTLFDPNEVIKIDENFLNTMAADMIEQTFELEKGTYIVIPTNMNKVSEINPEPYHGKFQIAVSTKHMEAIDFQPIDFKKGWKMFKDSKKWDKKTNGGSDRGSPFEFYHNYQYYVKVEKDTKISITMEQPDNTNKIGFYLFETKQGERKEIDFGELVEETKSLISTVCVGKNFKLKKGEYILVPCCSEEGVKGKFTIRTYSKEEIEIKELTKEWDRIISEKGKWEDGTAGGSINDPSQFVKNPQYVIKAKLNDEDCKDITILLSQSIGSTGQFESIGLPCFVNLDQLLEPEDINEDNVVSLPDAWVKNRNVFTCFEVDEEDGLELIVVPSTMHPNVFADFQISILTDVKDVTIKRLTEDDKPASSSDEEEEEESSEEESE